MHWIIFVALGAGAFLLYCSFANVQPISELGALFGFTPKTAPKPTVGSTTAASGQAGQQATNLAQTVQGGNIPTNVAPGTPPTTYPNGSGPVNNPDGTVDWETYWQNN